MFKFQDSDTAPTVSCGDGSGHLPSCAGLAVPYVPFQKNCSKRYEPNEALENGTLFPGLNLPFMKAMKAMGLERTPKNELSALMFVLNELGLYLDTHKDDDEALSLYTKYAALEKKAREIYVEKYGPLVRDDVAGQESYTWTCSPWPWDGQ